MKPKSEPQGGEAPAQTNTESPEQSGPKSSLLRPVEEKNYAGSTVNVDPSKLQQPLPEAQFGTAQGAPESDPFMDDIAKEKQRKEAEKRSSGPSGAPPSGGQKPGASAKPKESILQNPGLNDLPPEDKQLAAERLAKIALDNYEAAAEFFDGKLQVSEQKMLDIRSAGEIDMDTPIPVEAGTVTFQEFVGIYNEQVRGTIAVSPSFREDVEPPLVRVLAKHGAGLSDEQFLMVKFGGHMFAQGRKFFAQQATMKAFMNFGREMTKNYREQHGPAPAQAAPISTPPPPPPPEPPRQEHNAPAGPMPDMNSGAVQHMEVRQFGLKEDMRTINRASKRMQRSTITADMPQGASRRVRKSGGKKSR